MLKRIIFNLLLLAASTGLHAQCLEGNCKDGKGKYDFGYAVYTGEFKNGEPDGKGLMDYGKGEKYDGTFKKGKEDGRGLYVKDGQIKGVLYKDGVLIKKDETVAVGARPKLEGCVSGDCENGYGVAVFPSGNKYEGNFKNFRFSGRGKMSFTGGNILEGDFEDNKPLRGSFTYAKEAMTFKGTFNEDGTPNSGTYHHPHDESSVTIANNQVTNVHNPKADAARKKMIEALNKKPTKCPQCGGGGVTTQTIDNSFTVGGTYYQSTNFFKVYVTEPQTYKSSYKSVSVCTKCGGKGVIKD